MGLMVLPHGTDESNHPHLLEILPELDIVFFVAVIFLNIKIVNACSNHFFW